MIVEPEGAAAETAADGNAADGEAAAIAMEVDAA